MEIQMQSILQRYQQENAKLTERAIIAEAGVEQLQQENAELHTKLSELASESDA